ncbi:hypothetical protein SGLAM104S_01012 [Streptomyces glaucescens]
MSRTDCQSGPPRPSVANCPASASSTSGCAGALSGRRSTPQVEGDVVRGCRAHGQRDDGPQRAPAQQVGAVGGRSGGRRRRAASAVRPCRRPAAGPARAAPRPARIRCGPGSRTPRGVVGQFVVAPVALVERRMAQDGVGAQLGVGVRAQRVTGGGADGGRGAEGEPESGEGGEVSGAVLGVQLLVGAGGDGAQQGAGAAGGVEDGAGGAGEVGHEAGQFGGGEGVLARVGVGGPAEQELEGLPGAQFGGQFGGAAQQGGGGQDCRAGGGVDGPLVRRAAEPGCDHLLQLVRQHRREPFVGPSAGIEPHRRPLVDEQEHASGVRQRGDGAFGVPGELLPDALPQRDLGEFALAAQPGLDVGEGEGGAGLRAADRFGEVGVAAAPVAHGGPAHAGEPGDSGGGHLCRVVLHPGRSPRRVTCVSRAYRSAQHSPVHDRVPPQPREPC